MSFPTLLTPYNFDRDAWSDANGLACLDPSLAVQSERDETDINVIVERFGVTQTLPKVSNPPTYQDFDGIFDFQSAMNVVVAADRSFMELPAKVRARFGNDPQKLLEFLADDSNRDEALRLKLINPPSVESAVVVPADTKEAESKGA